MWSLLAGVLLTGCENDAASYRIDGSGEHAITLIREQRYLWDRHSAVALVVARRPDCQRRYALNPTPVREAHAELYQVGSNVVVLKNGGRSYRVEMASCGVHQLDPPDEAARGPLLGTFENSGDRLRFIPAAASAK